MNKIISKSLLLYFRRKTIENGEDKRRLSKAERVFKRKLLNMNEDNTDKVYFYISGERRLKTSQRRKNMQEKVKLFLINERHLEKSKLLNAREKTI